MQIAGPVLRRVMGVPIPDDSVFAAGEELFHRLDHMQRLLADEQKSSVRLVLNLEKMVIKEAQRSFTYFHLFGYPTDLIVCNRVLPEQAGGSYFQPAWEQQQRYLEGIDATFAPVPVRRVPFFDHEVTGLASLATVAHALSEEEDPTRFFWQGKPFTVERLEGKRPRTVDEPAGAEFLLSLNVPLAERQELSLLEAGDELVITVGRYRRNLLLPRALQSRSVLAAKLADGTLRIWFGGQHGVRVGADSRTGRAARATRA